MDGFLLVSIRNLACPVCSGGLLSRYPLSSFPAGLTSFSTKSTASFSISCCFFKNFFECTKTLPLVFLPAPDATVIHTAIITVNTIYLVHICPVSGFFCQKCLFPPHTSRLALNKSPDIPYTKKLAAFTDGAFPCIISIPIISTTGNKSRKFHLSLNNDIDTIIIIKMIRRTSASFSFICIPAAVILPLVSLTLISPRFS